MHRRKIIQSCGLHPLPDRRTFDRQFKVLPIQHMVGIMWQRTIRRRPAIERMFDKVKDTFSIEPLLARRKDNVSSYVLMCVFVYQIAIYWNSINNVRKPQCVKHCLATRFFGRDYAQASAS